MFRETRAPVAVGELFTLDELIARAAQPLARRGKTAAL
jgi:hypothetical protein